MDDSVHPLTLLKALSHLLNMKGGVNGAEEMEKIVVLMKECGQLVSRCVYLNVLRVTETNTLLEKFIVEGGWAVMNKWLVEAKSSENMALILEIMKLLQRLPLRIDHLKENSTPKLVKSLVKMEPCAKVKSVASSLMSSWLSVIRGSSAVTDVPLKKKKVKSKPESDNKKSAKKSSADPKPPPVSKAPSFAKFRKTGLEPDQEPLKKLLPKAEKAGTKRNSNDDTGIPEKKIKTEIKAQKKITISAGFMDALNSVPTVVKRPVKRKAVKPKSSSAAAASFLDKINPVQDAPVTGEACDFGDGTVAHEKSPSPIPSASESTKPKFNKYGKPMKSVQWVEESRLESIRYFEMEEGERVNVTTQSFKDMLHRERLQEREKMGDFHHKGDGDWKKPRIIDASPPAAEAGCNSLEKAIQIEREKKVLQDLFLDKVPDSPAEPDPEPYEMISPKIIPIEDPNDPGPLESRSPSPLEENGVSPSMVGNGESSKESSQVLKDKLREILQTATANTETNGSQRVMDDGTDNKDAAFQPPITANGEGHKPMYSDGQHPMLPEGEGYFPADPNMMMGRPPPMHSTNMMPPQMIPNDQYRMKWGPVHNSMGMGRPPHDMSVTGPPMTMRPPPFHPPPFRGNMSNSWRPREPWRGQPPPRQGFRGYWNGY